MAKNPEVLRKASLHGCGFPLDCRFCRTLNPSQITQKVTNKGREGGGKAHRSCVRMSEFSRRPAARRATPQMPASPLAAYRPSVSF